MDPASILATLHATVPGATLEAAPAIDMPTVYVDREHLLDVLLTLRDHPALQFALLADLTALDRLPAEPRFEIVYHLACLGPAYPPGSSAPARRLRLKVRLSGADVSVPSVTPVFPSANWTEREVFDLFGIDFQHHPDLRRILTPEDWTGHPLRKDYPVQVRKTPQSWSPVQVSAEEFAENIRAQRTRAQRTLRDADTKGD